MTILRRLRAEAVAAAVCGGWAAFFLAGEVGTVALLWGPVAALAVWGYRRRPVVAAVSVAGLLVLDAWLLGVPSENPWPLAALFVIVYALGRHCTLGRSLLPLAALLVGLVVTDLTVATIGFGVLLLATVWTFGFLVRRRTVDANRAAAAAARLATVDPTERAERVVADERARLASDALAVVRDAVATMRQRASDAAVDLDPVTIDAIQAEGRRAVHELRRLLGLLRGEPEAQPATGHPTSRRGRWRNDVLAATGLATLVLVEATVAPGPADAPGIVIGVVFVAAVVLRRADPTLACVVAVLPPATALALDVSLPYGLGTAAVAALLAWTVAANGRTRELVALGVFGGVLLLDVHQHQPGNEAITLAVLVLAAVAGYIWGIRDRDERSAAAAEAALRAEHLAVAERAVRAERLRLARELHDVVSHAVGVMVLQAGAASALRTQDRDRAREALGSVRTAGVQAMSELEVLFGLLDAGVIGAGGLASSGPSTALAGGLEALSARMRQAGLEVSLTVAAELPHDPDLVATAYRVVQEALTNAARYAPGAHVEINVRRVDGAVEVVTRDDGSASLPSTSSGGGFGLVGLRERVSEHGGVLTAGPRPGGGFEVTARLPIEQQTDIAP